MSRIYTAELAALVGQARFSDLPQATVGKAKLHLLDTLGAALAGATSDETGKATTLVESWDGEGASQVWGRRSRASARDAAFLNGVSAHAYELDDCGGCDHSGAVVVPAALAVLPRLKMPVSGQRLILAMVMGYEVGRRVLEACGGYEIHNGLGWHSTGTCGAFGAAAAASLVLNLPERTLASALGTACSFAGGTWSFIHDGTQAKKLHAGRAAEGGVMAALLAERSFEGPSNALQPQSWGSYLTAFGRDRGNPEALVAAFGERWRLDRCSIKPYATCRGTHSAIDAIDVLLDRHALRTTDIAVVEARMSAFQAGMCGGRAIETRAQAQMSLPYALAARLAFGQVFLGELEDTARRSPEAASWIARTTVVVDPAMADDEEPDITLVTGAGQRFCAQVNDPLGSPLTPLPQDRLVGKFRTLAGRHLHLARVAAIEEAVLDLESQADVRSLPALLAGT